jgi:flavin-dependent dehydrogenase
MLIRPRQLRHEIADAEGRFVVKDFAVRFDARRGPERDEHRAVAALAREPTQVPVNPRDARGRALPKRADDLLVEAARVGVKARGRAGLETVAQVAAGDERGGAAHSLDGPADARAEAYVVFVGEKAVAERDYAPAPVVAREEVERDGRAVIQPAFVEPHDSVTFFYGDRLYRGEEFGVEFNVDGCARGSEVGKIAAQTRAVVRDEGALFERRVRGDDDDRRSAASLQALGHLAHGLDGCAHLFGHRAADLRHHHGRVRGDSDVDESAAVHKLEDEGVAVYNSARYNFTRVSDVKGRRSGARSPRRGSEFARNDAGSKFLLEGVRGDSSTVEDFRSNRERAAVDSESKLTTNVSDAGERFDVLIVGAGPAGSFAAERIARGGGRVALFDGRPACEAKACGGGVTSKALKAWPFLLEAGGRAVTEVVMRSPAGDSVRLKLAEPFAIYSRRALDSYMRERARRAGAHVFDCRVTLSKEKDSDGLWTVRAKTGESWRGRLIVAADGANSSIAKRFAGALANAEMEVAFGYRTPLDEGEDAPTVIAFLPGWAGYAWAFPRLDHISFGIATAQDAFDHKALDRMLWDFMVEYYRTRGAASLDNNAHADSNNNLKVRDAREVERLGVESHLRGAAERYAARIPGLTPQTLEKRRAAGEDWALLGDAAGFADPVTGEGIYYALRSAELFAGAFLDGDAASYEKLWRADFGRELRRASQMRRRFYGSFWGGPFTDRMVKLARLHPGIRRTLRELVAGDQGYTDLKRVLARSAVRLF